MKDGRTEVDRQAVRQTPAPGLTLLALLVGALLVAVLVGQLTAPHSSPVPSPAVTRVSKPPTAAPSLVGTPDLAAPDLAASPDFGTLPDSTKTPQRDRPVGVESLRRCEEDVGGLVLGDRLKVPGWSLERWDCNAPKGPWSVVIRGTGGHFGVQSAVATFPVGSARTGTVVSGPPGGLWDPVLRRLVWPLAGSHAQIIGDLGPATLANLARSIAVVGGKPHLRARGGYTAVSTIPYASTVVHEMRYVTAALGQVGTLGEGSLYTGAMSGASFESAALEAHARSAGSVRGRPAIYFEVAGRFGTLAWQPAPGQVSYIGFSGASIRPDAVEALRALANRGKALTPSQW